jgi:hypothetical protein
MTARGAVVTITIERKLDGHLLRFSAPNKNVKDVDVEVPRDRLAAARAGLGKGLENFMTQVRQRPRPELGDAENALRRLHYMMYALGAAVMKWGSTDMARIQRFFVKAWEPWANSSAPVPVVEVRGVDDNYFPFEFLPVFDHTEVGRIADRVGLLRCARRFLGFTCAVRRTGGSWHGVGWNLPNGPLRMTLIRHAGLSGVAEEVRFFQQMKPYIEIDGPWPPSELGDDAVVDGVVWALFDPKNRIVGEADRKRTQIHHFACHCRFEGDWTNYAFILAGDDKVERAVPLDRLGAGYGARMQELWEHEDKDDPEPPDRSLVFINACGSAFVDPVRLTSFPDWFLHEGHRGVIGTETLIPDTVAAEYAKCFYRQLLTGSSLGTALVKARLHLLEEYCNPLGLLYTLYADPDIMVENPVPAEIIDSACLHL